jgi:hypothetical protein
VREKKKKNRGKVSEGGFTWEVGGEEVVVEGRES